MTSLLVSLLQQLARHQTQYVRSRDRVDRTEMVSATDSDVPLDAHWVGRRASSDVCIQMLTTPLSAVRHADGAYQLTDGPSCYSSFRLSTSTRWADFKDSSSFSCQDDGQHELYIVCVGLRMCIILPNVNVEAIILSTVLYGADVWRLTATLTTRKLCYSKDDRAMRAI